MFLNLQAEVIFSCHLNFVNIYISYPTCLLKLYMPQTHKTERIIFVSSVLFLFFFFFLNKLESDYFGLNPNYI